jgi:hypothetical protein
MKCILCNQRKGKRHCPAKNAMICAQCCGEKRILEIDCPESCQYLQQGRSHEVQLESARHLRTSDPMKQQMRVRVLSRFEPVVGHLEYVLAKERRASRDLTDSEVAEALDLLLQTYRTEGKGILYEHTSTNLRIDILRKQLGEIVKMYRDPPKPRQQRLKLEDAVDCLEFIRGLVASHIQEGHSATSYVDFLARTMPRGGELDAPGSSLIIPG